MVNILIFRVSCKSKKAMMLLNGGSGIYMILYCDLLLLGISMTMLTVTGATTTATTTRRFPGRSTERVPTAWWKVRVLTRVCSVRRIGHHGHLSAILEFMSNRIITRELLGGFGFFFFFSKKLC